MSILKDAPLRGSVIRCGVNRCHIAVRSFSFLSTLCVGDRGCLSRNDTSFLVFPSMTTKPLSPFFPFLRLAFLFLSCTFFSLFNVKLYILFLASAEFYDPLRYIYALSKWEHIHMTETCITYTCAMVYKLSVYT